MRTKTQRKKATSEVTAKASKTSRYPLRGNGRESKVLKSERLSSDEQYRELFDDTSDLVQSVAPDGRILYTNKAWRDVLGYSKEEIAHLKLWDIISPESMDHCMELFKRVMDGEHVRDVEAIFVAKDGRRINVEGNSKCRFVRGKPVSTQGFFHDVTRRKQAEEVLAASEARYRSLVETTGVGVASVDLQGNFIFVNETACEMIGYPQKELIGKAFADYINPDDAERMTDLFLEAITHPELRPELEFRVVRKDGHVLWLYTCPIPVFYGDTFSGANAIIIDISERKRAEEALRQSEERYRTVLEQMDEAYFEVDIAGNFTFVNDATCRQLGYSREGLTGMNYRVYTSKDDVKRVYEIFNKVYRTGKPKIGFPVSRVRKDGARIFTENSAFPLRNESGKIIGFRGVVHDITERKRLEEYLEKERQELRLIIDSSPIIIFYKDKKGRFVRVNKALAEALKIPEEEFVGKTVFDLFPAKMAQGMTRDDKEVLKSGRSKLNIIEKYESADGMRWVQTDKVPLFGNGGTPVGILGFGQDITERKQAEETLANEATRRRILIEQSRDGIVVLDENGKVYEVNQRFAEMLGYTLEEARRLNVWDWEFQFPREQVQEMVRTVDEKGDHFETRHRRKDGTTYDVEISTNGAVIAGQKLIFCVCRDITARKRAEEELRQSEERYRTVLEEMEEGYFEADVHGNFTVINDATCYVLGYPREEIIGTNYRAFVSEEYVDALYQAYNQVYQTGKTIRQLGWEVINRDGGRKFIEASISPLRDRGGQIVGFRGIGRDITERKKAEEALANEATRRRILFDHSRDGIVVLDEDAKVVEANQQFAEMLGYTPEEVRELHTWDWDTQWTREELLEKGQSVDEAGVYLETKHRRKDGTIFDVGISINGVMFGGQKLIFCVCRDITERKQAEEAIRHSEQNFRDSIESSPLGIRVFDKDGKTLYVNQTLLDMWGYRSIEELEAVPRKQRYPPQSYVEHMERVKKGRGGDMPSDYEVSIIRGDGQVRHLSGSTRPLLWNGERQFQAVYQDITVRKQTEEALRESEERYRFLIELSPEAIFVSTEGKHVFINSAAMKLLVASSPEQIIGKPATDFVHPDYREIVAERMRKAIETGIALPVIEEKFIRLDGKAIDVEVRAAPLVYQGKTAMQAVVSDITERKQAEESVKKLYSLQTSIRYINESLLKVHDEQALFEQVCRFLADVEFIKFCWIGLTDKESLEVKPVAYSGFEDGYLSSLKIHLVKNKGPVGVAIKTRQPCTVADIENDSRFKPRREAALKRGYASSLAVPLIHEAEVIGVLSVYSGSKGAFGDAEINFLVEAASDIALGISTLRLRRELQQSLSSLGKTLQGTVSALASVAEVRDPYTSGHQQRVTRLAVAIATEMGLPQEQIEGIHVAGTLHDVGKLYVPAEILSKPGRLSEVEFNLVKMHSQAGYDILKTVEFPWPIAQIVLQHHERLDGSGYPQGLKGEDILLEAKILAVADVVEAMASHRPYRPSLGMGQALDEIAKNSGILYDPKVVDACFRLFYEKEFKLD